MSPQPPPHPDEDWRVKAALESHGAAASLHEAAGAFELYEHARRALAERAVVAHDGTNVYAYATSQRNAAAAQRALEDLARQQHSEVRCTLERWHPLRNEWESADVAADELAPADETLAAEREEAERESSVPQYELRLQLPTHREAIALAHRLAADGVPTQRHWHYLLIGAWTVDDAQALEAQLRADIPAGATVKIEHTLAHAVDAEGRATMNPFVRF